MSSLDLLVLAYREELPPHNDPKQLLYICQYFVHLSLPRMLKFFKIKNTEKVALKDILLLGRLYLTVWFQMCKGFFPHM